MSCPACLISALPLKPGSGGICGAQGLDDEIGGDDHGLIVDGFTHSSGSRGDRIKQLVAWIGNANSSECNGKSDAGGKGKHFVDDRLWLRLKHELSDEAKCYFFTMHIVMGTWRGSESVVDGVRGRKA